MTSQPTIRQRVTRIAHVLLCSPRSLAKPGPLHYLTDLHPNERTKP